MAKKKAAPKKDAQPKPKAARKRAPAKAKSESPAPADAAGGAGGVQAERNGNGRAAKVDAARAEVEANGGGPANSRKAAKDAGELTRRDVQQLRTAVREKRIDLPALQGILDRIQRLGLTTASSRLLLSIGKLCLEAERINQSDEHKGTPDEVIIHANTPVTADGQRAAILRAIAAERSKRSNRRGGGRAGDSNGNGQPE